MEAAYRSRNGMVILLLGCLETSTRRLANFVVKGIVLVAVVEIVIVTAYSSFS